MNSKYRPRSFLLLLAVASLLLVLTSVIVAVKHSPATSYEFSLYDTMPIQFWALIILSLCAGQVVLILSLNIHGCKSLSRLGILTVALSNLVLLLMPVIRGYQSYGRDDAMTHIGWTRVIALTGCASPNDIYPVVHIIGANVNLLADLQIEALSIVIPVIFSTAFYVYFFALASMIVGKGRVGARLSFSLGILLLFGNLQLLYAPFTESFFLVPVVLYCYLKAVTAERNKGFAIALIVFLFAVSFMHPLTILVVVLIILASTPSPTIHSHRTSITRLNSFPRNGLYFALIAFTLFFAWQSYAYLVANSLSQFYEWLSGAGVVSEIDEYISLAESVEAGPLALLSLVISTYGTAIILGATGLACVLGLQRKKSVDDVYTRYLPFSSRGFIVLSIISVVALVSSYQFGFFRFFIFAMLFSSIITGACFESRTGIKNSHAASHHLRRTIVLVMIVTLLIISSTYGLYLSPRTKSLNQQVTEAEITGIELFISTEDPNTSLLQLGISYQRFSDSILGQDFNQYRYLKPGSLTPPPHFGYDNNSSFASSIGGPTYLLLNEIGRQFYTEVYPEYPDAWDFTADDFSNLRMDSAVNRISDNGNLEVYLITP